MRKLFFTAVLMTTGVVFASAQSTEMKNNDAVKKTEAAKEKVAVRDTSAQAEIKQDSQIKMTDPNLQTQSSEEAIMNNSADQPATEAKKVEKTKKK